MSDRARAQLQRASDTRRRAEANSERARRALASAIVEAAHANIRQVEIVKISGYSREHVRRIVRTEPQGSVRLQSRTPGSTESTG